MCMYECTISKNLDFVLVDCGLKRYGIGSNRFNSGPIGSKLLKSTIIGSNRFKLLDTVQFNGILSDPFNSFKLASAGGPNASNLIGQKSNQINQNRVKSIKNGLNRSRSIRFRWQVL